MYERWEAPQNSISARQVLSWLKKAKTWQLLLVLLLVGFVSATFLRLNNIGMIESRKAVLQADEKLDNKITKQKLTQLQNYVSSHMNSDMGKGIVLINTYQRDYDEAVKEAAEAHNTNSDVYQKASIECRAKFRGGVSSFRNDYVTCVANAVSALPENQQTTYLPRVENYHYNFASPMISLDFAGFFTIVFVVLCVVILLRLVLLYTLKFVVKKRAKIV